GFLGPGLPGPASLDFDGEGPGQEGANEHEQTEDRNIVQGGLEGDRPDHIAGDEKFQSQQERPAHLVLVPLVGAGLVELKEVANGAARDRDAHHSRHDDHSAQNLDAQGGPLDDRTNDAHDLAAWHGCSRLAYTLGVSIFPARTSGPRESSDRRTPPYLTAWGV